MEETRKMCRLVLMFLASTAFAASLKEGDTCVTEGVVGSCKNLTDCPYADKLIRTDKKRPTHCAWNNDKNHEEVVCCPLNFNLHKTGQFRNAFGDTLDGKLRSKHLSCWYDGDLPLNCCEEKRDFKVPPEPAICPALPKPTKNIQHLAWEKCVEYQRYVNVCELVDSEPKSYRRRDTCVMSTLANKISGGVPALHKEFPHMALLGCHNRIDFEGEIKWIAGGTLISEKYILTAAHVVSHRDYGLVRYALLGALAKSSSRDGVLHNIVRYEKHESWSIRDKYNDIALLELNRGVIFSDFIRPACLALPEMKLSRDRILAGWGETGSAGEASDVLLKTIVKEYKPAVCNRTVDKQALSRGWDASSMICAGAGKNINDSCHGDSGGPLMAYVDDDLPCTYAIRGIVSWGSQCGQGSPGVYTNVNHYLDWIVERVWGVQEFEIRSGIQT